MRLAHALLFEKGACPEGFKEFRRSALFPRTAKAVADAARRILKQANRMGEDFVSVDITGVLTEFEAAKLDFNDLIITNLCERENLTLVTDDQDFSGRNLPILTANALLAN